MRRGDHIYVRRDFYTHHGIYRGGGLVIHYTGRPGTKRNAVVRVTSLEDFAKGRKVRVRRYAACDSPRAVLERAEGRIGESSYNLAMNNCEHFAKWCKTGRPESVQVKNAIYVAEVALAAARIGVAAGRGARGLRLLRAAGPLALAPAIAVAVEAIARRYASRTEP